MGYEASRDEQGLQAQLVTRHCQMKDDSICVVQPDCMYFPRQSSLAMAAHVIFLQWHGEKVTEVATQATPQQQHELMLAASQGTGEPGPGHVEYRYGVVADDEDPSMACFRCL